MSRIALFVLGILGLVCATAVQAQSASERSSVTGSRFSREKFNNVRDARSTLSFFGRCVATYRSDRIKDFLLNPAPAKIQDIVAFPNSETHCVNGYVALKSSYREIRGSLSEAWYLRAFPDSPPAWFTDDPAAAPSQEEVVKRIVETDLDDRADVIVEEFARCVAAIAPVETDKVLRTPVATKDERVAINRLAPNFGPCAFEGQQLSFDEASLRSALAYALAAHAARGELS
jgi:hypothetical protein